MQMASQTPATVQNENNGITDVPISGKGALGAKVGAVKPQQKDRKERKALADLSKARTPSLSKKSAVPLKGKSSIHGNESTNHVPKSSILTDEEIRQCNEWAAEGLEHVHFSGNDLFALQKHMEEKRVKKKVEKVMSALSAWPWMTYSQDRASRDVGKVSEDVMKLELESEMLPPLNRSLSISGNDETDDMFLEEHLFLLPYPDLKLKEEYEGDAHSS